MEMKLIIEKSGNPFGCHSQMQLLEIYTFMVSNLILNILVKLSVHPEPSRRVIIHY